MFHVVHNAFILSCCPINNVNLHMYKKTLRHNCVDDATIISLDADFRTRQDYVNESLSKPDINKPTCPRGTQLLIMLATHKRFSHYLKRKT